MIFKFDLFASTLWLGLLCGTLSSLAIQKIKQTKLISNKKRIILLGAFIDFILGIGITLQFTNLNLSASLCVGLFTYIGAETIYEKLKSKGIMKSLNDILKEEKE